MAFNVTYGTFAAPTVNSTTTIISLAANFDPKAIMIWTSASTAQGATSGHARFAMGFGDMRGGIAHYGSCHTFWTDALPAADTARGQTNSALLVGLSAATPTTEWSCGISAMNQGASSDVRIFWGDAPATAIICHYIIFGGSDVLDASAFVNNNPITGPTNVAITSFGRPTLILTAHAHGLATTTNTNGSSGPFFGVATQVSGTIANRGSLLQNQDAAAAVALASWQKAAYVLRLTTANAADAEIALDAVANWPTDGFRITNTDAPAAAFYTAHLALRLSADVEYTLGASTARTTTGTTALSLTSATKEPMLLLAWGSNVTTGTAINSTHADLGEFFIGASDGINEGYAAIFDDDAALDARTAFANGNTKTIGYYQPAADPPTLTSEADTLLTATTATLDWTDADTVAREFNYLVLQATPAVTTFERGHGANVGESFPTAGSVNYGAGDV